MAENTETTAGVPVEERIAVVGMAARLPGASDIAAFWENLRNGVESITFFDEAELLAHGHDLDLIRDPQYIPAHGALEGSAEFDAEFFGYSAREAELIDPQQRIFLECGHHALEDANIDPTTFRGRVGVFAGAGLNTYFLQNVLSRPDLVEAVGPAQIVLNSDKDYLATRVAYKLGLTGLSLTVQSACSSSLAAVQLACQSLLSYQCDAVIAGGVRVSAPRRGGYRYTPGGVASADGHSRAYDAAADGSVGGDGAGAVVLKRLADAQACGDVIHAVILAAASNNDGSTKAGFTAPSVSAQADVITEALALADVDVQSIGYVEGHGTATKLGDPVEVAALSRVFRRYTDETGFCALGSVKTNIGHLDAAAGIAGLIKAVLAVRHGELPPSLHFTAPHPALDLPESPFYVNDRLRPWPGDGPRRAGVSSFGLGGTNVHVVLEEAPRPERDVAGDGPELILVSGQTPEAVSKLSQDLAGHLRTTPEASLAAVAHTSRVGRRTMPWRRFVVADGRDTAIATLTADPAAVRQEATRRPVTFMFPGHSDFQPGQGRELYDTEPQYRADIDECAALLTDEIGVDLRRVMFPEPGEAEAARERLSRNEVQSPAGVAATYALARLLMSWGIAPGSMIGYSTGEYPAACLSGVLTLRDCLRLVAVRGRLFDRTPRGGMLVVPLAAGELTAMLPQSLTIAGYNGPASCTVSGLEHDVTAFHEELERRGTPASRLPITMPAHSPLLEPVADELRETLSEVTFGSPRIPYVSTLTGDWIDAETVADDAYWMRHFREPVQFGAALRSLTDGADPVLVECGFGHGLSSLARQQGAAAPTTVTTLYSARDEPADDVLAQAIGRLWASGVTVDWERFRRRAAGPRRRTTLPTYPYDRREYWVDPAGGSAASARAPQPGTADIATWFTESTWRPALRVERPAVPAGRWLVFVGDDPVGPTVVERLRTAGADVDQVVPGTRFAAEATPDGHRYTVNVDRSADYGRLMDVLAEAGRPPDRVLHLWSLDVPAATGRPADVADSVTAFEDAQPLGFYSLLFLAQALDDHRLTENVPVSVVGSGLHAVTGTEGITPVARTILGACRVIPQENAKLPFQVIDIDPGRRPDDSGRTAAWVLAECAEPRPVPVALRGRQRWMPEFSRVRLPEPDTDPLRTGGSYLITGGADEYAEAFSRHLIDDYEAHVTVVERPGFPEEAQWGSWLDTHPPQDPMFERVQRLCRMRDAGTRVEVVVADVAVAADLRRAIGVVRERYGRLDGVLHTAGLAEERVHHLVRDTTRAICQEHFRRRAHSTMALAAALDDVEVDFCLVQSTLSAHLGGLGRVAGAAAAIFAAGWIDLTARDSGTRWFSTDWDSGEFEVAADRDTDLGPRFTPAEAVEVVRRVAGLPESAHLIVLADDIQERLDYWVHGTDRRAVPAPEAGYPRPPLPTPYEAPRNETEQKITEIWQQLLGIDKIGVQDDLFTLGGHSLLAVQLVSRLRQELDVDFPLRKLFDAPTVAGVAEQVVRMRAVNSDMSELESLLDELEGLDDDLDGDLDDDLGGREARS